MTAVEAIIGVLVLINSLPPAVAVLRCRRLRELLMYQLVASVSLAETLIGAISVIIGFLKLLDVELSSWTCVVGVHFRYSVAGSTAVCFFCISLERYVTVIHGLRYYDILTDGRRRLLLAAPWLSAAIWFCTGVSLQWLSPQGVDLRGETCEHWRVVTLGFRFFGAVFSITIYLINAGINIRVGIAGFSQARKISRVQASIAGNHTRIQLQHRGFVAIAVLSLIYCVFVVPHALYNISQMLGLTEQTATMATGYMRLFGMMADGWCLTLLCPMLRVECMKMYGCRSKRRHAARPASGNHRPRRVSVKRSGGDSRVTLPKGNGKNQDGCVPQTLDCRTLVPARVIIVSSPSVERQAEACTPPAVLCRGREVLLLPLDLADNSGDIKPVRGPAASRPTHSAPLARPPPPTRHAWSRQHSNRELRRPRTQDRNA